MAFGTNGLTIKKMETIAFLKYFSVAIPEKEKDGIKCRLCIWPHLSNGPR